MDSKLESVLVFLGSIIAILAVVGGCTVFTQGIQRNDRDRGIHQTQVKKACIESGKILVNNNCIPSGK